jgi:hypothetical protein
MTKAGPPLAGLATVLILLALASASAGASVARPPVALTASPARVDLAGSSRSIVRVRNAGTTRAVLDVRRAGFRLDLRGRPRIVGEHGGRRSAAPWLEFRPRTLAIAPGAAAAVSISSRVPPRAEPGDHDALLLFTTRRRVRDGLAVRVRMGVVVVVRAPGRVVHRFALGTLRSTGTRRGRVLELAVRNRGNVTEYLERGRARISLERGGRRLATLGAEARSLRPGTRGLLRFLLRRARIIGPVSARVDLRTNAGRLERLYRLRL